MSIKRSGLRWGMTLILLLGGTTALVTLYYQQAIHQARQQTPTLVAAALAQPSAVLTTAALPEQRKRWLLAIEDPAFFQHHGVDLTTPGAGMTTITQGLAKQLYFPEGFKPGVAKIRQTLLAQYALDAMVSKDEQLRLLLNVSYFGQHNGVVVQGFAAAAQEYFHKSFADLTDDEFLALVAMLIAPNNLQPGTSASAQRVQRIHAYLAGEVHPASLWDVEYTGKQHGSLTETLLVGLLKLLTDA